MSKVCTEELTRIIVLHVKLQLCKSMFVQGRSLFWCCSTSGGVRPQSCRCCSPLSGSVLLLSVHSAPVAAVAGHEATGDEENQINEPPDPQSSQSQQFPHGGPGMAQAESIHSKATQEKRVEQSGYKIVSSVPAMEAFRGEGGPRPPPGVSIPPASPGP